MQIAYIFCYILAYHSYFYYVGVSIEKKITPGDRESIWNCVGQMLCRLNVTTLKIYIESVDLYRLLSMYFLYL